MNRKHCLVSIAASAVFLLCALGSAHATTVVATNSTFYFTGTCSDCTGYGTGTLVLQNYTPAPP